MRNQNRSMTGSRKSGIRLTAWMHLIYFVMILACTTLLKIWMSNIDWIIPSLADWELAALVHVLFVAQRLIKFRGFEFASKRVNLGMKMLVLYAIIFFIILKLIAISFETQAKVEGGGVVPLLTLPSKAAGFTLAVHAVAPYILVLPLIFFFAVNFLARWHVIRQARKLGINDTVQERYLAGLMKFVDAPVVFPFAVMLVYLKFVNQMFEPRTEDLVISIIGCCLLIVSNLLTGVFDEHWSDMTRIRRVSSSGEA